MESLAVAFAGGLAGAALYSLAFMLGIHSSGERVSTPSLPSFRKSRCGVYGASRLDVLQAEREMAEEDDL